MVNVRVPLLYIHSFSTTQQMKHMQMDVRAIWSFRIGQSKLEWYMALSFASNNILF